MANGLQERWGRETRLLVLIVVVSLAVLLVLARFRFPAARLDVATPAAPSPLANLVSRAAFEDLAEAMASTATRIAPRVVVVRVTALRPPPARGARAGGVEQLPAPRLTLGLRVRPDMALVRVPAGMIPTELVDPAVQTVEIVGADSRREIALVKLPEAVDSTLETSSEAFPGFAYLGLATATVDGPTMQPVFIGRAGARQHERWPAALIGVDNANVTDGSWLFTIQGRLVGLAVNDAAGPAVVPPSVLETAVVDLLAQRSEAQ